MNHLAQPSPAPLSVMFAPMTAADVATVHAVEQNTYAHPWSLRNLSDSLAAGHHMPMLLAQANDHDTRPCLPDGRLLLGYLIAMPGVDEVHLLNITVALPHQRQGWARLMLDALITWSRGLNAQWLWLEVRRSNAPAQALYLSHGFETVNVRRDYYPLSRTEREDALVMRRPLWANNAGEQP